MQLALMQSEWGKGNMSYRLMQKFWLDIGKRDERDLAQQIVELKNQRAFTSTIRDALRLFLDLKQGNIDVLIELFPFVKDTLQPAQIDKSLQEQIKRLEDLLLAQGNVPIQPPLTAPTREQRTHQAGKSQIEIKRLTGKSSAETTARNFLNSMSGLASGFFD